MAGIRSTHDFLTVGGRGAAAASRASRRSACPATYYAEHGRSTPSGATLMMRVLRTRASRRSRPQGAYYVMADVASLGFDDDVAAAAALVEEIGRGDGPGLLVLLAAASWGTTCCGSPFCKKLETLEAAGERLRSSR